MKTLLSSLLSTVLFFLTLVNPVSAGGGDVYIDVAEAMNNDPHWAVVRAYIAPSIPCANIPVTFSFQQPKEGDIISTTTEGSVTGVITAGYTVMIKGKQYPRCSTYAKIYAKDLEFNRILQVDAQIPDGRKESRIVAVSFRPRYSGDRPENEEVSLPWDDVVGTTPEPTPTPANLPVVSPITVKTLTLAVLEQKPYDSPKGRMRKVLVKWYGDPVPSARYRIYFIQNAYAKPGDAGWTHTGQLYEGPSATIYLSADDDWYVRVEGCTIDSPQQCMRSTALLVPKYTGQAVSVYPTMPVVPSGAVQNEDIERLRNQVSSLEGQLAEAKQKQNALERVVENLIKFIRTVFPFFP